MASQHFFLGQRYLGSREIPSYRIVPGLETRWHHSYAHFCPRCGDIWARIIHDKATYTQITQRMCPKHASHFFSHDGRLSDPEGWSDSPITFADDWPVEATRIEFNAAINHYEVFYAKKQIP